ncbi:origin recognition complex subunit 4 C-terminus-domain-containing protein [Irpex lacteus]|nr:origin recognition complex subunit 4 C-terminus-domain-containing protein [Irpex lacteus]
MAIKRKATVLSAEAPPTKRITRSRRPLEDTQPVVPVPEPPRRTRSRKVLAEESVEEKNEKAVVTQSKSRGGRQTRGRAKKDAVPEAEPTLPPKPRRGRPPRQKQGDASPSEASSSNVTLETLQTTADPDDSPDELLLSSPPQSRPSTPERTPPQTEASPRVVLDAVVISTPPRRTTNSTSLPRLSSRRVGSTPQASASPLKRNLTASAVSPRKPESPRLPTLLLPRPTKANNKLNFLAPLPPTSPTKAAVSTPFSSPRKAKAFATPQTSPSRLPRTLPSHLHASFHAQRRAALRALHHLTVPDVEEEGEDEEAGPSTNAVAQQQLTSLLKGTVERGEGNSCLLIGPRGSGKTQILETAISALPAEPIVIRLSGHVQHNDRLAMREIARQLAEQTGNTLLSTAEDDTDSSSDENPFLGPSSAPISLPPPSHLLALISTIPTLPRPTIVILDAIDLFALHARQALLYCLLDTVQSMRGSKGMAVVGVTTRVDTVNMLEKRVKSRFSGRMVRCAPPGRVEGWVWGARAALCAPIKPEGDGGDEEEEGEGEGEEWGRMWEGSVVAFFDDPRVREVLRETFSLSRDVRLLSRLLVCTPSFSLIQPVANLTPTSAFLTPSALVASASIQRCPPRFPLLNSLNYPSICLLIAAIHARTSGHEAVTFEMLHETFRDQLRTSLSAPVQVEGGGIGMMRCSREILVRAFEILVAQRLFIALAPPAVGTGREFVKYRCAVERADVKRAVEKMGQLSLKKWFSKAQ